MGGLWYGSWWTEKWNLPPEGEQWTEKELPSCGIIQESEGACGRSQGGMQQVDENAALDTLEMFAKL